MCARFDVTPRTLRYYEYIELLRPERIGRSRSYGQREIARMTLILRGRKWGFSLEEIRQWLMIYEEEGTDVQMRAFIGMADQKIADLKAEEERLREAQDELLSLRNKLAGDLGQK